MTPAVKLLNAEGIVHTLHRFTHHSKTQAYGDEAVTALALDPHRVFKTLVIALDDGRLSLALVPVNRQLGLKQMASAMQARKAWLADVATVQRATGYVLGGVSPLAQKRRLATCIDDTAKHLTTLWVSGGQRGLEIELAPDDLASLTQARFASISV